MKKDKNNNGGIAVDVSELTQGAERKADVGTVQGTARQTEGAAVHVEKQTEPLQEKAARLQSAAEQEANDTAQPHETVNHSHETVAQSPETAQTSKKALKSSKKALQMSKKVSPTPKKTSQPPLAPDKLTLLVTVVNREKGEYFLDLLQSFGNLQMAFAAVGTAAKTFGLLAPETEKTVIFSVATQENAKLALAVLEEKFASIRQGKGVAFSVPLTCTIGVAIYKFLCNKEG